MKIAYKRNKLQKQLSNATEIKKTFGVNAKRVASRIYDIEAAPNLAVLMQIPQTNCHPLIGSRQGEWAVNISANHRLIFEIAHDPVPKTDDGLINTIFVTDIQIIEVGDYH